MLLLVAHVQSSSESSVSQGGSSAAGGVVGMEPLCVLSMGSAGHRTCEHPLGEAGVGILHATDMYWQSWRNGAENTISGL